MVQPLRVLFDTNSYDFDVKKYNLNRLIQSIKERRIIVYGFNLIRDELRAISFDERIGKLKLRNLLLTEYDAIVRDHLYRMNPLIAHLAEKYGSAYQGSISKHALKSDFLIVACASIHGLDILVSQDKQSMRSIEALNVYENINQENGYCTPRFLSVEEFDARL